MTIGYKIYYTESGILKVLKGNLVVMKAEKITSNIYMFLKDTLQDSGEPEILNSGSNVYINL